MPAKKHPSSAGSEAKKIDDLALSRKDGDYKLRGSAVAVVAVLALGTNSLHRLDRERETRADNTSRCKMASGVWKRSRTPSRRSVSSNATPSSAKPLS